MRFSLTASLLASSTVHAFSDSSPFIFLSTSKLAVPVDRGQLQPSSQVVDAAKALLSTCPTNRYVLISQPSVHANDIRTSSGCRMPSLCRKVADKKTASRFSIAEVLGQVSSSELVDHIRVSCLARGTTPSITEKELKALPSVQDQEARMRALRDNDHEIGQLLDKTDDDYTVLFFSDPNEFKAYQPMFSEPVRTELKRQVEQPLGSGPRLVTAKDNRPLFEKYQFLTPGIFMTILALIVIGSILGVGLRALASLQVPYKAFDKDMGPAAQKKP